MVQHTCTLSTHCQNVTLSHIHTTRTQHAHTQHAPMHLLRKRQLKQDPTGPEDFSDELRFRPFQSQVCVVCVFVVSTDTPNYVAGKLVTVVLLRVFVFCGIGCMIGRVSGPSRGRLIPRSVSRNSRGYRAIFQARSSIRGAECSTIWSICVRIFWGNTFHVITSSHHTTCHIMSFASFTTTYNSTQFVTWSLDFPTEKRKSTKMSWTALCMWDASQRAGITISCQEFQPLNKLQIWQGTHAVSFC